VYDDHPILAALWPRFQARDLARLPNFEAAARVTLPDGRPRFGRLVVPAPPTADVAHGSRIRGIARKRWPVRTAVEADLYRRFGLSVPDGGPGETRKRTGGSPPDAVAGERETSG
jgi:hypothetical protein